MREFGRDVQVPIATVSKTLRHIKPAPLCEDTEKSTSDPVKTQQFIVGAGEDARDQQISGGGEQEIVESTQTAVARLSKIAHRSARCAVEPDEVASIIDVQIIVWPEPNVPAAARQPTTGRGNERC